MSAVKRIAFGIGEPPREGMPWRVVAALEDARGRRTIVTLDEKPNRAEAEQLMSLIRADCMTTLERLQDEGLLPAGPLSKYVTDIH